MLLVEPVRIETVSDALLSFVFFLVMQRNEQFCERVGRNDVISVGCLVTDLVPETLCNKCTSYCTALDITFDCVSSG